MELFDFLDINGNPTGIVLEKGATLKDGQYYLGIHAYIFNSGFEFLIQRRSYNKSFAPGIWDIHLGHMIAGESSVECMIREVKEEIGLNINCNDICAVKRFFWDEKDRHIVDIYFIRKEYDLDKIILQKDEVIAVKKIAGKEMTDMIRNMDYRPCEYRNIVLEEIKNIHPMS
ncbi:MAG: NUDIX domain-containing protein [Oscillospiraceae bacterium]|nr:NUDIX domain-containing protein [Oscillospiraceae bacterium]